MKHEFFKDLDLSKLKLREIDSPFKPKVHDCDLIRENANVIKFKDLQESLISKTKMEEINSKKDDFAAFDSFTKG